MGRTLITLGAISAAAVLIFVSRCESPSRGHDVPDVTGRRLGTVALNPPTSKHVERDVETIKTNVIDAALCKRLASDDEFAQIDAFSEIQQQVRTGKLGIEAVIHLYLDAEVDGTPIRGSVLDAALALIRERESESAKHLPMILGCVIHDAAARRLRALHIILALPPLDSTLAPLVLEALDRHPFNFDVYATIAYKCEKSLGVLALPHMLRWFMDTAKPNQPRIRGSTDVSGARAPDEILEPMIRKLGTDAVPVLLEFLLVPRRSFWRKRPYLDPRRELVFMLMGVDPPPDDAIATLIDRADDHVVIHVLRYCDFMLDSLPSGDIFLAIERASKVRPRTVLRHIPEALKPFPELRARLLMNWLDHDDARVRRETMCALLHEKPRPPPEAMAYFRKRLQSGSADSVDRAMYALYEAKVSYPELVSDIMEATRKTGEPSIWVDFVIRGANVALLTNYIRDPSLAVRIATHDILLKHGLAGSSQERIMHDSLYDTNGLIRVRAAILLSGKGIPAVSEILGNALSHLNEETYVELAPRIVRCLASEGEAALPWAEALVRVYHDPLTESTALAQHAIKALVSIMQGRGDELLTWLDSSGERAELALELLQRDGCGIPIAAMIDGTSKNQARAMRINCMRLLFTYVYPHLTRDNDFREAARRLAELVSDPDIHVASRAAAHAISSKTVHAPNANAVLKAALAHDDPEITYLAAGGLCDAASNDEHYRALEAHFGHPHIGARGLIQHRVRAWKLR